MNRYKSLILIGLFAVGFTACKTDDLEKDIDALKERVESYEMQVQKLNDEMNIIRVLLDGNKTITDYSIEGDKYTLTLSNGETIVLTQGNDGGNYPTIEIGANGNWFIDGNDTGERAEAENGENTQVTPKFEIKNDTWRVSYDGGEKYVDLGKPATGTPEGTSPINDFEVSDDGSEFTFTINGKSYVIPVVKGLICEILNEQESYVVERGKSIDIKVKVAKGDLVRAVVPAEWKATVSNYTDLTNEQELTITVTAPNISSKCVLSVEVTSGVNTASDEVTLRTATTSYYDDYMAGLDIEIDGIEINKFDYPIGQLNGNQIEKNGVYFLENSSNVNISISSPIEYLVILCDNGRAKCTVTSTVSIENGLGFLAKNIDFTSNDQYLKITNQIENVVLDNCNLSIAKGKNLIQADQVNNSIKKHFIIKDSNLKFNNGGTFSASRVLNSNKKTLACKVDINNNIFYSESKEWAVNGTLIFCESSKISSQIEITDNSFINFATVSHALVRGTFKGSVNFNNLLFWVHKRNEWHASTDYKNMSLLLATGAEPIEPGINSDNILYYVLYNDDLTGNKGTKELNLNLFSGTKPSNLTAKTFTPIDVDPYNGGEFNFTTGTFKPSQEYSNYGARRN